jgi:hypothetical protein
MYTYPRLKTTALESVKEDMVRRECLNVSKLLFKATHAHHHLSPVAAIIGQIVTDVPSGLGLIPHQIKKKHGLCMYVCIQAHIDTT